MPELAFIDNAWPSFHYGPGVGYVNDTIAALGRWGYYASVSFTDHNVGIILDGLDRLQLSSNTVGTYHNYPKSNRHKLNSQKSNPDMITDNRRGLVLSTSTTLYYDY